MADRLAIVAARIISPNQYGFVHGKQIHHCIGVAYKAINMFSKNVRGGNVAYKVDIYKALDTLSWKFVLLVLTRFGFHSSFVSLISTIFRSAMLSIRINDSMVSFFFPYSRGMREGDPLSPLLFCLADEVLSRGIPTGYITPYHILYADDIFVL